MSRSGPRRVGLHGKLALNYLVVGLTVSLVSLLSTWALQRHASIADSTRFETSRAAEQLAAVTGSAFEEGLSFVLTGDTVEREACLERLDELRALVGYVLGRPDIRENEAGELREIDEMTRRANVLARRMFDESARGERPTLALHAYEDAMDQIIAEIGGVVEKVRVRGSEEEAAGRALLERSLLGIAFAAAALSVALGSAFGKRLTRPIVRLRDAATAFGQGATAFDANIGNDDEIGDLAAAFRHMAANVRRLVATEAEQRARLENVFASMHEMVIVVSPEGRILTVNRSCLSTLGCEEVELVGKPVAVLFDGDVASGVAHWGRPGSITLKESIRMRGRDGRSVPVSLSTTPMLRSGGQGGAVLVAQDLTERRRLESELRHAQKLEAVGRLASGIAHEINTPIQFVSDNAHFLQDGVESLIKLTGDYQRLREALTLGGPTEDALAAAVAGEDEADLPYLVEEMPRAARACLDGVGRVATIVRSMKEFAHPGGADMSAVDLNRAILSTLTMSTYETKTVADIATDLEPLPPVFCDLGAMNQVVLNLVVNAAHAVADVMKATGRRGTISVRTRQDAGHAVIAVTDTGGGIPRPIQEHIFEPFFTTKDVGVGTGQGLAIARSVVVDSHGGTLTFETETGVGTTFIVRIPIAPRASRPSQAAA